MQHGQVTPDLADRITNQMRAAQYVRMSTDHQKYSIANQKDAISGYAAARNLVIVKTYEDPGRSGLRFETRNGLKSLIADVKSGLTDFDNILVYDVSRWGRFQDVDESAYYEFICKQVGIKVHYCAEQFENDGSLTASVLKSVKRAMAAEFSRELSVKVFASQSRTVSLGFKAGGVAGYALRRRLVDHVGNFKGELRRGERKGFQSDRVLLVPGPRHEIEIVQRIYRLFLDDCLKEKEIAEVLNQEGILTEEGRAWTGPKIHGILTKEKYIGNQVFNRSSQKLQGRVVSNPPEMWIRHNGAFAPIVSIELFEAARRKISGRICKTTDEEIVDQLKGLLRRKGSISTRLIDADRNLPSSTVVRYRFGTLLRARELAGYRPKYNFNYLQTRGRFRSIVRDTIEELIRNIEYWDGVAEFDRERKLLTINNEFTASIQPAYCDTKLAAPRWRLRPNPKAEITIALRMNESNTDILDYFLLPRVALGKRFLWAHRSDRFEIEAYRCNTLETFFELCSRQQIGSDARRSPS